jgi:predicted nucleic acid-binding protein
LSAKQTLVKSIIFGIIENMDNRLYLDNCSFNRPYDDQNLLKNYLEAEAKTFIQRKIWQGTFELAWSYMMDYEISFNPFLDRKNQILKWKEKAKVDIDESEKIITMANNIMRKNIKSKDALHLACAIEAECKYFITTDGKILNKFIDNIIIVDPLNFVRMLEV